ncbi:hypothetical protein B0F90DRAFT_746381 [Multifurca ochricompacta]|uniref:Uncharacterized protein n=1 Tax=Multifurca ochricompacta TaxID=376703 RepID=A0AAD4QP17_9AGAM|nr:hypothetical protein B0F90DRAFT_746381 [Multifurca ochricompacta]
MHHKHPIFPPFRSQDAISNFHTGCCARKPTGFRTAYCTFSRSSCRCGKRSRCSDSPQTSEHERDGSENGSEADVESNDGAGVGESWISLKLHPTTSPEPEATAA